jgi:ribosomal protein S25
LLTLVELLQEEEPDGNEDFSEYEPTEPFGFLKRFIENRALLLEKAHEREMLTDISEQAVLRKLRLELSRVQALRTKLEKDVANLREMRESFRAFEPHIVMIRELTEGEAEKEIVDYLQTHDHADTGELVEKLGIDVDLVLNIVQRLKQQGKVERVDSHRSG